MSTSSGSPSAPTQSCWNCLQTHAPLSLVMLTDSKAKQTTGYSHHGDNADRMPSRVRPSGHHQQTVIGLTVIGLKTVEYPGSFATSHRPTPPLPAAPAILPPILTGPSGKPGGGANPGASGFTMPAAHHSTAGNTRQRVSESRDSQATHQIAGPSWSQQTTVEGLDLSSGSLRLSRSGATLSHIGRGVRFKRVSAAGALQQPMVQHVCCIGKIAKAAASNTCVLSAALCCERCWRLLAGPCSTECASLHVGCVNEGCECGNGGSWTKGV